MAVDFGKFDNMVNQEQLQKDINSAPSQDYDDVPAGKYIIGIERMELKPTKAGNKLMFAVGAKIKDTLEAPKKQTGRWIFFNRVICGNKNSDKWNDGIAIKAVITWLEKIYEDEPIEFNDYSDFAELIESLDIDGFELEINYDPKAFNPIKILEVYDC